MQLEGNTVLVTGGASGIGLALATRFLRAGSDVLICGRREDKLADARRAYPALRTRRCDVASEAERRDLIRWAASEFPTFNVLVNNAGIQRRTRITAGEPWAPVHDEIVVNFEAPVQLSQLVVPQFLTRPRSAIINVTSGLAFVPMVLAPIYSATKAALHSFTLSLRHELEATPIEVVEIIPPAVNTDLGGPGLHTSGVAVDEFADTVIAEIAAGAVEAAYGFAKQTSRASRAELDATFDRINRRR